MTTRSFVTALATALVLSWGGPASAQPQAKCLAGKTKCMAKKVGGLIKCEQLAETPGKAPDANANGCVDKVKDKFDGGVVAAKGCFEKLESKNPNDCITFDDTASAEGTVDSCVATLVAAIDPPPLTQSKCGAGKKKCVSNLLKGLLKCHQLAQTPGKPTAPNANGCIDKATAKYTGGADLTKGCFEKLENKNPNDCEILDDSGTLQGLAEDCVDDFVAAVNDTTTTTTTTTTSTTVVTTTSTSSTTTTTLPNGVELQGALPATPGRFNYNLSPGLPGANSACNTNFPGTHACTYPELLTAESAGDLVGLQATNGSTVTSFWAIDNSQPALEQCNDNLGSLLNWEYTTAHTASRGQWVSLNNGTGELGTLQTGGPPSGNAIQCNFFSHWVGCCI
jgi:hypothetical protein